MKQGNILISLIKNLLNNTCNETYEIDSKKLYSLAKFHSIQNLLYYSYNKYLKDTNEIADEALLNQLKKDNKKSILKTATFEAEEELLKDTLNNYNIPFMVMKGNVIKHLYPSSDMRSMADIDIYFDKARTKEVKKIMKDLGYHTESYEKGNHDTYMKEPFMNVEMHRDLMNECYEFSVYYKNFFSRLIKKENNEFIFSLEDYYVFMNAHSAKHFSNGGTGIRSVIDEYIYLNKYENELDFNYINVELEKLGLIKFEKNIRLLSKYWFSDIILEDKELNLLKEMEEYIFESGTYGTTSHAILKEFMGEDTISDLNASRIKYILRRAFPPFKTMCARNPIIKKCPILLPIFWFTRLIKAIFRMDVVKSEVNTTKNVNDEDIKKNKKMHDEIGA